MLKHVKRINISIHTMDENIYEEITNRKKVFRTVLENLRIVRGLYPSLEIRLNTTPCKANDWNIKQLKNLISFAEEINATVKCTELFPNTDMSNCITITELRNQLEKLEYSYVPSNSRKMKFTNTHGPCVFLTQCTCSKAVTMSSPVDYCRNVHDLYVNHDGTIPMCRLGKENMELWEEVKEKNIDIISKKMEIAMRRVSSEKCNRYLKGIY